MSFSTGYSVLKPAPPKICTASATTWLQWSAANTLAMDANMVLLRPWSISYADFIVSRRLASIPVAMSASMNAITWWSRMGTPMVTRSRAYFMASSIARRDTPTAPAATGGRVLSNAPMATLNPCPSEPSTFSFGTTTLSKKMGRVSLQRCPIFTSLSPTLMPSASASTTKPVIFFPTEASGSVTANTKYHPPSPGPVPSVWDRHTPPLVIQSLEPLITKSSPFFTARVLIAATSLPAPASDTPYAHLSGASVIRPKYFFLMASDPARITGI
mmetsp:Transcript_31906/g.63578  ORF Transcript_31906/g.63578 Transcript_31906/m.63578 type:complete len:272 (-) Transcript_31906:432-1247(-)